MTDAEAQLLLIFSNILLNAEAQNAEHLAFILDNGNAVIALPFDVHHLVLLNKQYREEVQNPMRDPIQLEIALLRRDLPNLWQVASATPPDTHAAVQLLKALQQRLGFAGMQVSEALRIALEGGQG